MVQILHEETIHGPLTPYGADIHDLTFSKDGTGVQLIVFAGNLGSARNVEFDISDNATFLTQYALGPGADGFVSVDFGDITFELSTSRIDQVLSVANGDTNTGTLLTSLNNGQSADEISVVGIATSEATFLVSTLPGENGLAVFQKQGDGLLNLISAPADSELGHISDIVTFTAYGITWVVGTSLDNESVESFTFDYTGVLTHSNAFGAANELGVNTPVSLATFMLGEQPYVVFGSTDTASLSVLRLEADGSFTAVDHILDDLATRFDNTSLVETMQVGEDVYVLAAGSDDGFSLFRVRSDGKLQHLESVANTGDTTLDNVSAVKMVVDGSTLRIILSSATETGLTHFSYDLAPHGDNFVGTTGDDAITGTALDDIILGGDGDDLIVDGAGSDILTGGQGTDIFTLTPDGVDDTILDFQRGQDALDLSFFPLLYDLQEIGYVATSFGARLAFQGETINIYSDDGTSLSLADLSSTAPFNVNRPALVLGSGGGSVNSGQTQVGTDGDDNLVGTGDDDILTGNRGDDILTGGGGADALYGGLGFDTASYTTATSGVLLDMEDPSLNTGDANGDTFASIEAIAGTGFADQIFGTAYGDTIFGNNGGDQLSGREGNDWLQGGSGDDVLIGGPGGDFLAGG